MKLIRSLLIIGVVALLALVQFYRVEGIDSLRITKRGKGPSFLDDLRAMLDRPEAAPGFSVFDDISDEPIALPEGEYQTISNLSSLPKTIRIGTFNLHQFSREKISNPETMELITRLIRQMDVIALQEIDAGRRDLLPKIVEHLNRTGRSFDYIAGPKIGPTGYQQRLAFVFDRSRVEADRKQTYTMADPANQIAYEPLVAWFRTTGIAKSSAWTFSLANVYIDPDNPKQEETLLSTIFQAIHSDGRKEDDVILAGCFFVADYELSRHAPSSTSFALEATPTDIYNRHQTSNLLFSRHATTEFMGNSGAIDFLRQHNLTIAEAEAISDHLPVWAEFQIQEDQQI